MPVRSSLTLTFALLLVSGCTDLSEFSGSYRGGVVGADDDECPADRTCSFIRRGFPDGTQLELADFRAPTGDDPIGTLTTDPGAALRYEAFTATPLSLITPLEHDQLSHYDFPGGGRVRNYIFTAPLSLDAAGTTRDAMIFLSLMEDDDIEVRIVVGSGTDELGGDHFGLFILERQ